MAWEVVANEYWQLLLSRLIELIKAPALNPEMGWIIAPLILTVVLMTFYFGKYTREELGWNTAIGNSVVLLFVAIDLLRYLFHLTSPGSILNFQDEWIKSLIALGVASEGITLLLSNFFKALPKHVSFFICSPLPVNLQAYVAIAIVYTDISFDWATLVAAIMLFLMLLIAMTLIKKVEHWMLVKLQEAKEAELEEEKRNAEETRKAIVEQQKKLKKQNKS
ncbi:hypothetical protein HY490_05910 [Candidatus Woesearchaeota archaeon]|nr:hypothetical protein [Candidatus Woesearchaeota archaeon]